MRVCVILEAGLRYLVRSTGGISENQAAEWGGDLGPRSKEIDVAEILVAAAFCERNGWVIELEKSALTVAIGRTYCARHTG
jgi:hypothetical protein